MYEVVFQDYQIPPSQGYETDGTLPNDPPPDPPTLTEFVEDVETILAGTGETIDDDELALLTPDEWESFLAGLFGFVDATQPHGSDQNSYYDDHSDEAPLGPGFFQFMEDFGWLPSIERMAGYHYYDYLTQNIDPEFLEMEYAAHLGTATLLASGSTLASLANMPFGLTVNGHSYTITWHSGPPPGANYAPVPDDPGAISVRANLGYWIVHLDPPGPALGGETMPHGIDLMHLDSVNNPYLPAVDQALRYLAQDQVALQVLLDAWHHGVKIRIVTGQSHTQYLVGENVVEWNPTMGLRLTNGGLLSPAMCLLHELAHAAFNIFGSDLEYDTLEDRYIVEHVEQIVGPHLGEPMRENHQGTFEHAFTVVYHLPASPH